MALVDWMPALQAEENIRFADLIYTFAQSPINDKEAKAQGKRRKRYTEIQDRIIKKIRSAYSDDDEKPDVIDLSLEPTVDFSTLNSTEQEKLKAWAKSIGAK